MLAQVIENPLVHCAFFIKLPNCDVTVSQLQRNISVLRRIRVTLLKFSQCLRCNLDFFSCGVESDNVEIHLSQLGRRRIFLLVSVEDAVGRGAIETPDRPLFLKREFFTWMSVRKDERENPVEDSRMRIGRCDVLVKL